MVDAGLVRIGEGFAAAFVYALLGLGIGHVGQGWGYVWVAER